MIQFKGLSSGVGAYEERRGVPQRLCPISSVDLSEAKFLGSLSQRGGDGGGSGEDGEGDEAGGQRVVRFRPARLMCDVTGPHEQGRERKGG